MAEADVVLGKSEQLALVRFEKLCMTINGFDEVGVIDELFPKVDRSLSALV
jgi:hypothetical protein